MKDHTTASDGKPANETPEVKFDWGRLDESSLCHQYKTTVNTLCRHFGRYYICTQVFAGSLKGAPDFGYNLLSGHAEPATERQAECFITGFYLAQDFSQRGETEQFHDKVIELDREDFDG